MLGVTLGAMVIGLTIITALLGLSFATQASAIEQQKMARERRAADGALEVGVESLREGLELGTNAEALCSGDVPGFPSVVKMQLDKSSEADEQDVTLECEPALDPTLSTSSLVVSGDSYAGGFGSPPLPSRGTLRHVGDGPLRIVGDAIVKDGAALQGGTLGARVSGTYRQGAVDPGTPPPCGDLTPDSPPSGSNIIDGSDGQPTCGSAVTAGLSPSMPSPGAPPIPEGSVPSCASGSAVTPGKFDAEAMEQLNILLDSCDVVTFDPGPAAASPEPNIYWFDAGVSGSLEFGRADATYIFGSADADGECDPDYEGQLKIVLGGGTSLDHTAGALSICGGRDNPVTITQAETAITQPTLNFERTLAGAWTNAENLTQEWGASDPTEVVYCALALTACPSPKVEFTVDSAGVGPIDCDPGSFPGGCSLRWKSEEFPPAFADNRQIWVVVSKPGVGTCTAPPLPGRPRGRVADGMGLSVDLTTCDEGPRFDALFPDGDDLDGASMTVEFKTFQGDLLGCTGECPWTARIGAMELEVNDYEIAATTSESSSPAWSDPQNLAGAGNTSFSCVSAPLAGFCNWDAGAPTESTLEIGFTSSTLSDANLDRLLLELDVSGGSDAVAAPVSPGDPESTILLRWPTETQFDPCVSHATYSSSRRTQFYDLTGCIDGRSAEDLDGLAVRLAVKPEASTVISNPIICFPDPVCYPRWGVRPPSYSDARLSASTSSVNTNTAVSTTIDRSSGAYMKVYGNTVLPDSALDVRWAGAAGVQPIFSGNTEFGSVGSVGDDGAEVGVVCCDPEFPSLVIGATTDPQATDPRGVARVRLVSDATGGSVSAEISDWQLCDGGGCEVTTISP